LKKTTCSPLQKFTYTSVTLTSIHEGPALDRDGGAVTAYKVKVKVKIPN